MKWVNISSNSHVYWLIKNYNVELETLEKIILIILYNIYKVVYNNII